MSADGHFFLTEPDESELFGASRDCCDVFYLVL